MSATCSHSAFFFFCMSVLSWCFDSSWWFLILPELSSLTVLFQYLFVWLYSLLMLASLITNAYILFSGLPAMRGRRLTLRLPNWPIRTGQCCSRTTWVRTDSQCVLSLILLVRTVVLSVFFLSMCGSKQSCTLACSAVDAIRLHEHWWFTSLWTAFPYILTFLCG